MNDGDVRQDFRGAAFRKNRFLFFSLWLACVPVTYVIVVLLKLFLPETAVNVITIIYISFYGASGSRLCFRTPYFSVHSAGNGFYGREEVLGGRGWGQHAV